MLVSLTGMWSISAMFVNQLEGAVCERLLPDLKCTKEIYYRDFPRPDVAVNLFGILGSYLFLHIWENILIKLGK